MFQSELDVDETLAQLLVAEGFTSLEEVAYVEVDEIASIEGLDDEIAGELAEPRAEALERREAAARERRELGVEDALAELPYLTEADAGDAGQGRTSDARRSRRPRHRRADPEEAGRAAPPRETAQAGEDKAACWPTMA
jgi:transcription termination factor NusA